MTTQTFSFTGAAQSFTVPAFVYSIDVVLRGAGQGSGITGRRYGAYVSATIPVLPGDVIQINCGGQGSRPTGGFNGGANGGTSTHTVGGGGFGATDIRIGGTTLANRIAVAGGQGGAGSPNGSSGGAWISGTSGKGVDNTTGGTAAAAGGNGTSGGGGGGGGGGGWNGGNGGAGGANFGAIGDSGEGGTSHCAASAPRGAVSNIVIRGDDATANAAGSAVLTYIVATPTAPTLVGPLNNVDRDASATITLRGQFNSPSPASHVVSASFRYKAAGAGSWTTVAADTIADPDFSYAIPAGTFTADVQIEWQAQTTDNAANTGPWSASWFFTPRAVPSAPTITAPTAAATINDLSTQPIVVATTTGQTDTQYRRIGDLAGAPDDTTIYEDSGPAGATVTHTFTDGAVHPSGPEHWQARVRTNSTLWSPWGDVAVDAEIMAPPIPMLTLTLLDGPVVEVRIVNPTPTGSQSATDHTDLYRTGPDGQQIRIAANLTGNAVVTDYLPAAGENDYQAIAYSANGASAVSA